jgi:hypothetical protein
LTRPKLTLHLRHDHFFYVSKSIDIVGDNWTRENNLVDVGFDPEKDLNDLPVYVVKSGTDFREFAHLKLEIDTDGERKRIKHMTGNKVLQKMVCSEIQTYMYS